MDGISINVGTGEVVQFDASPFIPVKTPEQVSKDIEMAVILHVEKTAHAKRYDSSVSCVSYVGDPDPVVAAEAAAFKAWRSSVWITVKQIEADVLASLRSVPTPEQVIAELPARPWTV